MKKIVILGAGGFGREVQWLIERINQKAVEWEIAGYIDDNIAKETCIDGYTVLGGTGFLKNINEELYVACAVGNADTRCKIMQKLKSNIRLKYPNLIDPSVISSERIKWGEGNIVCAGTILTTDIEIGNFSIINLDCTIGHDAIVCDYVTVYPSVNISGCVKVEKFCEIGTGTNIIQGKRIGEGTIIGAGSVVIRELPPACTAVGCPAKPIAFHNNKNAKREM